MQLSIVEPALRARAECTLHVAECTLAAVCQYDVPAAALIDEMFAPIAVPSVAAVA